MTSRLDKTFNTEGPRNMLDKLDRELDRIDAATTLEDAGDHCQNAILTAWHIQDWIWKQAEARPPLMDEIRNRYSDQTVKATPKDHWKNYLRKNCRELDLCRILSVRIKHADLGFIKDDKLGIQPTTLDTGGSPSRNARWKLYADGDVLVAGNVLETVHGFWNVLLSDLGFLEDEQTEQG